MNDIKLYRKRLIPDEVIYLKYDDIIYNCDDYIVTRWDTIRKRNDFTNGLSIYDFVNGIKVSKFINNDELVYHYIDIVEYDRKDNKVLSIDLLVDIVIMPDGFVKVLDLEELSDALDSSLISIEQLKYAINTLNTTLMKIYDNGLGEYEKIFDTFM